MWRLLILSSIHVLQLTGENDDDRYYGVPLGGIHYSADSTQAETYAADEYTVIFHRFTHRPRQLGCTSMIIGPARATDSNTVAGEGVFLSISQPLVASVPARTRLIRQAPLTIFGTRNWPAEFDHLTLRKDGRMPTMSQQNGAFDGIELDTNAAMEIIPKTKDIDIGNFTELKNLDSSTLPTTSSSDAVLTLSGTTDDLPVSLIQSETEKLTMPVDNITSTFEDNTVSTTTQEKESSEPNVKSYTDSDGTTTSESTTTVTDEESKLPDQLKPTKTTESEEFGSDIEFENSDTEGTTTHATEILKKTLQAAQNANEHSFGSSEEGESEKQDMKVKKSDDTDGNTSYEEETHPSQQLPVPDHATKAESRKKADRKDKGYMVMLGQPPHEKWTKKLSQHSAVEKKPKEDESDKDDYILSDKFFETDGDVVPVSIQGVPTSTTSSPQKSTPLFWVIEDPRLKKRRLKQLRKKQNLPSEQASASIGEVVKLSTTAAPPKVRFDRRFELPLIEDKTVAFSITNDAKITNYKWIGLYDHCAQRSIPLISLKGVDPPHEEKIGPLLSQSHNVTSHRVQILNCNTMLVPGFSFNQGNDPPETYFYVGIGHFPDRIEKQVRAYVIGQAPDQPLRNYNSEDVMIRLPKTYRTFDIDFVSVFNEVEERSYGHVIVPSLLVPPCSEHDAV